MTSKQYEVLCQVFLAKLFRIDLECITARDIPNPRRLNLREYYHQVDLCWEIETSAARYLHIANAKWRELPNTVGQADVLLLEQVKTKIAAHKAFLLTNTGFSTEAIAAAEDAGIALRVVRPDFAFRHLRATTAAGIQKHLESLGRFRRAQPLIFHKVVQKGFVEQAAVPPAAGTAPAAAQQIRAPLAIKYGVIRPVPAQGGGTPPALTAGRTPAGGYMTKNGPPPGFIKK